MIHSSVQVEYHGNDVNDKSMKVQGGKQCITMVDGYAIPLQIRGGLAYMDMHPPTDEEYDVLPHVVLISDMDWDPVMSLTLMNGLMREWKKMIYLDPTPTVTTNLTKRAITGIRFIELTSLMHIKTYIQKAMMTLWMLLT